jgi:heme oxygenase
VIDAAAPNGPVLGHLRAVTRPAHDRLEGALGLLDEHLDLAAYRRVIECLYGFWHGWQPRVAALLQDEALVRPRQRLHLLEADLAALGLSASQRAALPLCPLPDLEDARQALGSLYVMEGSTLGGRIIRRNVERRLGFDDRAGCAYFTGYGAETGLMWRSFLTRLDAAPTDHAERIGTGASATFECLADWFATGQV